jgi:hypothetical protein
MQERFCRRGSARLGGIQILPTLTSGGTVHVVVDVRGYFD